MAQHNDTDDDEPIDGGQHSLTDQITASARNGADGDESRIEADGGEPADMDAVDVEENPRAGWCGRCGEGPFKDVHLHNVIHMGDPVIFDEEPDPDDLAGDPEAEQVQEMTFEVPLRNNAGQLEVTLPKKLVAFHGFRNGDPVAFIPRLEGREIVFDIVESSGEYANERKIRRAGDWGQTYLRFPKAIADERRLFDLVDYYDDGGDLWDFESPIFGMASGDRPMLHIESKGKKHMVARTDPPMEPWFYTDVGESVGTPAIKSLTSLVNNRDVEQLVFEFPQGWTGDDVLGLEDGKRVAYRMTARHGELLLVMDFDIDVDDEERANVNTVFEHDMSYLEQTGSENYSDFRVTFDKTLAHAFGLAAPGKKVSGEFTPEPGRVVCETT